MIKPKVIRLLAITLAGLASATLCRAVEPFNYYLTDWSVVALKDYQKGTRITPYTRLILAGNAEETYHEPDATVQMRFGRKLTPFDRGHTKTLLNGWLPIVQVSATDGPVRYGLTFFATPMPTVKDWRKAYDWPTEGSNYLTWVVIQATNTGPAAAEAKFRVEQWGEKYAKDKHPVPRLKTPLDFAWSLAPGQAAEGVARLPFYPVADDAVLDREDAHLWLERTVKYWQETVAKGTRIAVPCEKAVNAFKWSNAYQLIASDEGDIKGGEGVYDWFYMRDGAYQVMALEEGGFLDSARLVMKQYLRHQGDNGRFDSTGQFDANGMAQWTLWQFFKITGDRTFLADTYPAMRRAADFTNRTRRENKPGSPYAGLLTLSGNDGENYVKGDHHIVGYDLWNLRGMLCTADAARLLGKQDEAKALLAEAADYRAAIEAAWQRLGVAYFPPSWEKQDVDLTKPGNDGTHWGNTENLWPTELFPLNDSRVLALDDEVRHRHGGGFTEGTMHWTGPRDYNLGILHTYLSTYTTMGSLARGEDEQVVQDFYWFLLHSTAAHAFSEGVYWKDRASTSDTIPHVTSAAMCSILLRHMLIHERGEELDLLAAVPDWWLEDGREIRIENAPTHFGPMSLIVRGMAEGVRVDLTPPQCDKPGKIVLRLPVSRPLLAELKGVEVVTRPNQKERWDFPTVVKLYEKNARPLPEPQEAK
ncbi:MAG: hypothetical protein WCQ21_20355 [Verrucomicrobiota bacterium]|jgi:hypothetical protein